MEYLYNFQKQIKYYDIEIRFIGTFINRINMIKCVISIYVALLVPMIF